MQNFAYVDTSWIVDVKRNCLNHADLDELWRYRRKLLTPLQSYLLKVVQNKIDGQPDKFDRERQGYRQMAGLVLMSNWDRFIDFCTCEHLEARLHFGLMMEDKDRPGHYWGKLNCGLWRVCCHCAWRREMDLQGRFLEAFDAGLWSWLTASFTGNLPMLSCYVKRNDPLITHADLDTYFQAIRFAVQTLYEEGRILGAILTEDIHLEWLYPVPLVTPHTHILVLSAEPITQADLDHFKNLMLQHRGLVWDVNADSNNHEAWEEYDYKRMLYDSGLIKTKPRRPPLTMVPDPELKVELPLSLDLQPLPTQQDFSAVLGYPAKPFDLPKAYVKTREALLREHPQKLDELAQNVDEFLIGSDIILASRRSPFYIGACDARRKRRTPYVGAPGKLLVYKDHRDQTKALLAKLCPNSGARH